MKKSVLKAVAILLVTAVPASTMALPPSPASRGKVLDIFMNTLGVGSALAQPAAPPPLSCMQQQQALVELESGLRQLAVAAGCSDVSQCQAAPVGELACGGPRGYVVYCTQTTNTQLLLQALEVLALSERLYNEQCGIVSICEFYEPPALHLAGGTCQPASPLK